MPNTDTTISFQCHSRLFERIEEASRRAGVSVEKHVAQVLEDHFFPAAKRRRDREARRRFYTYEIDPD